MTGADESAAMTSLGGVTGPAWVIMASGPSQIAEDIEDVRVARAESLSADRSAGLRVVAINNQVFAAPWADVLYSCDGQWWKTYSDRVKYPAEAALLAAFPGERSAYDPFAVRFGASIVPKEKGDGLGLSGVRSGDNSGHQALNLAFLRGARVVVLTGYDMQHAADGRRHNHADHPRPLGNFSIGMPALCARKFAMIAPELAKRGVRVINASRRTALRCFEQLPLANALRIAREAIPHPALPVASPASCGLS